VKQHSSTQHSVKEHVLRRSRGGLSAAVAVAALATAVVAGPVAAASPVEHGGDIGHHVIKTEYFPDDICGPRSGWTTFDETFHLRYTQLPDGSYTFSHVETGTYHTDFDDPTIPSYDSQFTEADHGTVTPGETSIYTSEFHDFPGTITIREHIVFVQVGDEVRIDQDVLTVDGCP
jgi:hypothetical protein